MSVPSEAYSWVDKRREWWSRCVGMQLAAKLRRALSLCGSDTRRLMAYDIVHEAVADGPKGYAFTGLTFLPTLHSRIVEHVTLAQCALSYDGLYEVVIGTDATALYLDIEVGRVGPGEGGLLSVDQMRLAAGDADFWWAHFFMWYLDVAARPWSEEEYGQAQSLMVQYLRDFFAEGTGWHHGVGSGGRTFRVGSDTKLVVSQCHRADCSKFSLHVVCPSLLFDRTTPGMKSFVTDFAVYVVYWLFKEISSYRGSMFDLSCDVLTPRDRAVLRLMNLHKYSVGGRAPSIGKVSPIDLCVYKVQGQLYRVVGMGKVCHGTLGQPLLLCGGDGRSPLILEENHGVGSVKMWLGSLVCMHRRDSPAAFFQEPCSWRSWFHLSTDVQWQRQRRRIDVASGVVPDDRDVGRRVEDIPFPLTYEEGPLPDFAYGKLLAVGGPTLARSLLGDQTLPFNTNRKGRG